MPSSRISSPACSQGAKLTPRRYKPRASRSVGSPARSDTSVKLSAVIQMDSFALSPMPTRRSVLTDITDIDIPRRKSWWKKLDDNSREIMEVIHSKNPIEANNAIEEYIEVDVLSQEKKHYTLDLPDSSDGESISSIVIPQRKLFTQKESQPQKKFGQIMDNRESLAKLHKSQMVDERALNVGPKNLFNQGTKKRNKPIFPSALLNISANKTLGNKTKELATNEAKGQVKSLFGNRAGTKRKNMFADFIVSESEDEISEIQPKVFGFQKKVDPKNLNSRGGRNPSPTSSMTDIEMDDWRLLPSSTMVDHQLEDGLRTTPSKRARLTKVSEATESVNTTANKTKQSNKTINSKNRSKNASKFNEIDENEFISPTTNSDELDTATHNQNHSKNKSLLTKNANSKNISHERSLRKQSKEHSKSKNATHMTAADDPVESDHVVMEDNELISPTTNSDEVDTDAHNQNHSKNKSLSTRNANSKNMSRERSLRKQSKEHSKSKNATHMTAADNPVESDHDGMEDNELICPTTNSNEVDTDAHNQNQSKNKSLSTRNANSKNMSHERTLRKSKEHSKSKNAARMTAADDSVDLEEIVNDEKTNLEGSKNEKSKQNKTSNTLSKVDQALEMVDDGDFTLEYENDDELVEDKERDETIIENAATIHHSVRGTKNNSDNINMSQQLRNKSQIQNTIQKEGPRKDKINSSKTKNNEIVTHESEENNLLEEIERDENISNNDKEDHGYQQPDKSQNKSLKNQDKLTNNTTLKTKIQEKHSVGNKEIEAENQLIDNPAATDNDDCEENISKNNKVGADEEENQVKENTQEVEIDHENSDEDQVINEEVDEDEQNNSEIDDVNVSNGQNSHDNINEDEEMQDNDSNVNEDVTDNEEMESDNEDIEDQNEEENVDGEMIVDNNDENQEAADDNEEDEEEMQENHQNGSQEVDSDAENGQGDQDASETEMNEEQEESYNDQIVSENIEVDEDDENDCHEDEENESCESEKNESHEHEENESHEHEENESHEHEENESHEVEENESHVNEKDESDEDEKNSIHEDEENSIHANEEAQEESGEVDMEHSDVENESQDEIDNEDAIHASEDEDDNQNATDEENDGRGTPDALDSNETHDTTGRHRHKHNTEVPSPEAILHDKTNQMESSVIQGRNTSVRKTKSMFKKNRSPSLMPIRESVSLSDGARDSSAEGSGWDSHRTTRLTIRQTLGRGEYTPRKSLRALVMEKSAKRRTNFSELNADISKMPQANSTELPRQSLDMDDDFEEQETIESDHEMSRKMRQTTLETYLQKVKEKNIERKKQLEEEVMSSLKAPTRDSLNPFKVPAVPKRKTLMKAQSKPKAKPMKSVIPLNMLPADVLEDMKYKPPKRYQPPNASWITKRLYKYLETKLEPKYDYKARVRSEKLVETIYNFTKDIRRLSVAPPPAVDALKQEMARLNVVTTHVEFYEFFHEYMPREVRVKVVPDVFNKISLPKHGVFSDILR